MNKNNQQANESKIIRCPSCKGIGYLKEIDYSVSNCKMCNGQGLVSKTQVGDSIVIMSNVTVKWDTDKPVRIELRHFNSDS